MILSTDLRERVIAAVDSGMRTDDVAKTFNVCTRVIYNWLNLRKKTGSLEPKSGYQKGHSHKITDWDQFKKFAATHANNASNQIVIEWEKLTKIKMSESAMRRSLRKIGYTYKKKLLDTPKQIKKSVKYSWMK